MRSDGVLRIVAWIQTVGFEPRDRERGQGTVEYIGMVVMVTLLVAAVAAAAKGWAPDIGGALKKALTNAIKKLSGSVA